jgi:hypothetical protein
LLFRPGWGRVFLVALADVLRTVEIVTVDDGCWLEMTFAHGTRITLFKKATFWFKKKQQEIAFILQNTIVA